MLFPKCQALEVGKLVSPGAETPRLLEFVHFRQDYPVGFLEDVFCVSGTGKESQYVTEKPGLQLDQKFFVELYGLFVFAQRVVGLQGI